MHFETAVHLIEAIDFEEKAMVQIRQRQMSDGLFLALSEELMLYDILQQNLDFQEIVHIELQEIHLFDQEKRL
ncbi:hypothetical protein D1872_282470 [compost metagenome]